MANEIPVSSRFTSHPMHRVHDQAPLHHSSTYPPKPRAQRARSGINTHQFFCVPPAWNTVFDILPSKEKSFIRYQSLLLCTSLLFYSLIFQGRESFFTDRIMPISSRLMLLKYSSFMRSYRSSAFGKRFRNQIELLRRS